MERGGRSSGKGEGEQRGKPRRPDRSSPRILKVSHHWRRRLTGRSWAALGRSNLAIEVIDDLTDLTPVGREVVNSVRVLPQVLEQVPGSIGAVAEEQRPQRLVKAEAGFLPAPVLVPCRQLSHPAEALRADEIEDLPPEAV